MTTDATTKPTTRDECPHMAKLKLDVACVPCQTERYQQAKQHYAKLKTKYGLNDEHTLTAAFEFDYHLITTYRLTECDELLTEIYNACKSMYDDATASASHEPCTNAKTADQILINHMLKQALQRRQRFYTQVLQSFAFLRFKQARFEESNEYFERMQKLVGDHERLLENMGHTYTSIGQVDKAKDCFQRALKVIDAKVAVAADKKANEEEFHIGGILLGLGMCERSLGKNKEALATLEKSYDWYKSKHQNGDNSILAKVGGHLADTLMDVGRLDEAEKHYREAVRIFTATCGEVNPLTSHAIRQLGRFLIHTNCRDEAKKMLLDELERFVKVDAQSLRMRPVIESLHFLVEEYKQSREQKKRQTKSLKQFLNRLLHCCKIAKESFTKVGLCYPIAQLGKMLDDRSISDEKRRQLLLSLEFESIVHFFETCQT